MTVNSCQLRGFFYYLVLGVAFPVLLTRVDCDKISESFDGTTFKFESLATSLPGGQKFARVFNGIEKELLSTMADAKGLIERTLFDSKDSMRHVQTVKLVVDDTTSVDKQNRIWVAHTENNVIHLHASALDTIQEDNLKNFIKGVLYHECTHVWQNNNGDYEDDPIFHGAIEGIADYMSFKSGLVSSWVEHRTGNWYDGYQTTAFFLNWLGDEKVKELNMKMAEAWDTDFFKQITSHTVEELWEMYQAGSANFHE